MVDLTQRQLIDALGCTSMNAHIYGASLNAAMQRFAIDTPARICSFLAQVGHESGRLQFVREIWNPAQCPWQAAYEGRSDLGNTEPGDGFAFKGRGLLQITGRANYRACGMALNLPLLETNPVILERRENATLSAAWFWVTHHCNELADAGDFTAITRRINGGLTGQADRLALLAQVTHCLGVSA